MQLQPTVLLLSHHPYHPLTRAGWQYAQTFCQAWQQQSNQPVGLQIFLYQDAVQLANRLIWLPNDQLNLANEWQQLAKKYHLTIQVCVSVALARGITDNDNAKRHQLQGDNLAENFQLVGLGELAMHLHNHSKLIQF